MKGSGQICCCQMSCCKGDSCSACHTHPESGDARKPKVSLTTFFMSSCAWPSLPFSQSAKTVQSEGIAAVKVMPTGQRHESTRQTMEGRPKCSSITGPRELQSCRPCPQELTSRGEEDGGFGSKVREAETHRGVFDALVSEHQGDAPLFSKPGRGTLQQRGHAWHTGRKQSHKRRHGA